MQDAYFGRGIIQLGGSRARIVDTAEAASNTVEKAIGHNCSTGSKITILTTKAKGTLKCRGELVKFSLPSPMIGKSISHHRILAQLGGGMGVVCEAEDLKLRPHVALKFLPPEMEHDPAAREHLQREAFAAPALNHPNICTIYHRAEDSCQRRE
jgi:hypothetical protein